MKVLKIVLVEDVETDAELELIELERAGLSCVSQRVETAAAFMRTLEQFVPDIVLSDFSLPRFDGLVALEMVRQRYADLPFIFVSGTIGEERAAAALKFGATDYVLKSSLKRLPSAVERAVREAQEKRARRLQQERIARLSRIQSILSSMNAAIVRIRERGELFREACRIAVDQGLFRRAWIGVPEEDRVEPVCWHFGSRRGVEHGSAFPGEPAGAVLSALAIRNNEDIVVNDTANDARLTAREAAVPQGSGSLAALPIRVGEQAVAAFVLHAGEPGFFDDDELKLLRNVTGNISFALEYIDKEERLRYLAYSDALTGLANRTLLDDRLRQTLALSQRYGESAAVILVDLDNFKFVNDNLGHSAGDELLRAIAKRLKSGVNEGDTVARYAGDEFVLILLRCGAEAVQQRVHALRQAVSMPVIAGGRELSVTCSVGVSLCPQNGMDASTLLKNANLAMYRAKEAGRNTAHIYTEELNASVSERFSVETGLRRALERDELYLQYQPQIDLRTRRIVGLEALVRWRNAELGLVSPARFIPIAEECGLIQPIGEWILRNACLQGKAWERAGCAVRIAVNLSVLQFRQKNLVEVISAILRETGLPAERLELELTESAVMNSSDTIAAMMGGLRHMGVQFSIDDFGTGYSSLLYLKRFPASRLKIDQSFVQGVGADSDDASIVRAVISLAHNLNLRVVAEGVEEEEQIRFLEAHGCDEAQGYYFGKPIDADGVLGLLQRPEGDA